LNGGSRLTLTAGVVPLLSKQMVPFHKQLRVPKIIADSRDPGRIDLIKCVALIGVMAILAGSFYHDECSR
jgi:hypothetical protein